MAARPMVFELHRLKVSLWIVWVGFASLWFAASALYPLTEPDEGRYAEISREMAVSGDWITPRLDGLKYFEKPPLQYWATAALYTVFGESEWTARAWSLALAFLCIPLTFAWVKRFYDATAGWLSVAVLASSPLFVIIGHLNLLDASFIFWVTAMVFAFTYAQLARPGSTSERNGMLGAWLSTALAVLTKGIVAPVLAGSSLLGYSLIQRDWRPWRRLHIGLGLPLALLVAAPWFIVVSMRNPEFPYFFFLHEHFARFLTTAHNRMEPWWYFTVILAVGLMPWIADLPAAVRRSWLDRPPAGEFHPLRFLLVYAGVVLIFFSASRSKLAPYILPLVPPLATVIGIYVAERLASLRRAAWITAGAVAISAVGLLMYALRRYDVAPVTLLGWILAAVLLASVALLNIGLQKSLTHNVAWLAAASVLAWQCLLVAHGTPPLARSARTLVAAVRPAVDAQTLLFSVEQYRQSVPPYLERTLTLVDYTGELAFGMEQEPGLGTMSFGEFERQWRASKNAVAFFDPEKWQALSSAGFPGRILGADRYSIAVSRQ